MEKKKERSYASGHRKREERKKREENKSRLRAAMGKFISRNVSSSDSKISNSAEQTLARKMDNNLDSVLYPEETKIEKKNNGYNDDKAIVKEKNIEKSMVSTLLTEESVEADSYHETKNLILLKDSHSTNFEASSSSSEDLSSVTENNITATEKSISRNISSDSRTSESAEKTLARKMDNNPDSVLSPEEKKIEKKNNGSNADAAIFNEVNNEKSEVVCMLPTEEIIEADSNHETENLILFKDSQSNNLEASSSISEDLSSVTEDEITEERTPQRDLLAINMNDPALWPPITDSLREHFINYKIDQNINHLDGSKKLIGKIERMCSANHFYRLKKNGEIVNREWLVYSPSAKSVFCFICKLYGSSDQALCNKGFSDWRNVTKRLSSHENSDFHRKCMYQFSERSNAANRIDNNLLVQYQLECNYWKKVLHRVVSVIKFMTQRGLAFFGDNETFGSVHNGNFLGILELLSKYDSFLAEHINSYGNKGKGSVNYLSSTIVTELIDLMSKRVFEEIISEVKESKYFGLIVDSTPDITHVDQLSIVLRYVNKGEPIERFLTFIQIDNHTAQHLQDVILNFLESIDIDLNYCRGQSFDNASNMSGKYTGLQARLKQDFPLIHFVPCSALSLNLVGTNAVDCCTSAISFFGFVQSLYNFFAASTHRWQLLNEKLFSKGENKFTLKSLSGTRWSANAEAVKALRKSYIVIMKLLDGISNSEDQNSSTRHDAKSLHLKMSTFETSLMTVVWDRVLQRMNSASKTLQSENCKMGAIVPLYDSLIKFVKSVRNNYDEMENEAELLVGFKEYLISRPKRVPKSRMLDESSSSGVQFSGKEQFLYQTFYVICDSLITELNKRKCAYEYLQSVFGFMCNDNLSDKEINESAKKFQELYSSDIEEEFPDEFIQFKEFVSKGLNATEKLKLIKSLNIEQTFPNVETALRIMLSIPITNCSSERSFSVLKRIKNRMRSSLSDYKLSGLALLSIESDLTNNINFDTIIEDFAKEKSRKKPII